MNITKIIYWAATAVMCLMFIFSASMYFLKYEDVAGFFTNLGFPTWLIYPMAVAKILGVIAILTKKSRILKEWAYAGFFYDGVLAFFAHYTVDDGGGLMAGIAVVATIVSRVYDSKIS